MTGRDPTTERAVAATADQIVAALLPSLGVTNLSMMVDILRSMTPEALGEMLSVFASAIERGVAAENALASPPSRDAETLLHDLQGSAQILGWVAVCEQVAKRGATADELRAVASHMRTIAEDVPAFAPGVEGAAQALEKTALAYECASHAAASHVRASS